MIYVNHVSKRFGRRAALENVCLQIMPGEVTLLLGPNGAGKSTLLRSILGIADFEGQITVNGLDPLRDGPSVRSLIGYMPQTGGLHGDLTVSETLSFWAAIRRVPVARALGLAREAGIADQAGTKVRDLSGGMRQRLGFAIALLTDPPILILDEPSSSLDAASREWVAERLRSLARSGRTVLVSTHAGQELVAVGDRRIVLEAGHVVEGVWRPLALIAGGEHAQLATAADACPASSAIPVARKELRDAIRNRWMVGYSVLLGVLGLVAAAAGFESSAGLALQTFGRTTATLMNLCLLLAPIVAVLAGAAAIAGEQDRGTLELLLSQPIARGRLLLSKYAGLLASLAIATFAGFAPAGLFVAVHGGAGYLGHYLLFPAIAVVLAAAMLGIGFLISISSRTAVQAQGAAVFVWFAFVLLYDLLLMGTLTISSVPIEVLAASLVVNPVDAARVLGVLALEPDLYLLGPAGAYLTVHFTRAGAGLWLAASLAFWVVIPVVISVRRFRLPTRRHSTARVRPFIHSIAVKAKESPSS
jgi:ABC-type multidrug transport system ATPase subunit/ABC-type transport system involved in multi-copper enzyme maturation permease subunit